MYISALSFLATAAAVTGFAHAHAQAQPPRLPSRFSSVSRPPRGPTMALSDHYRVISTADFRVASSRTHAHATMISALICSARHSARIPSGDNAAAAFLFYVSNVPPGTRESVVARSNLSISVSGISGARFPFRGEHALRFRANAEIFPRI